MTRSFTRPDTIFAVSISINTAMRKIAQIIIHCTATPVGRDFTVADIDRCHSQRGFNSIGYHYVVYRDGSVHRGRPESVVGAHCKGHNARSIGVAYVGGLDSTGTIPADTRTPAQRRALRTLVADLRRCHPAATVHGHREFAPKACPCFDARTEYANI